MTEPTYPTARVVAARVQAHFAHQLGSARDGGRADLATAPDAVAIEALIDAAFWASLRREEGLTPKISLAFLSTDQAGSPLTFSTVLPLTPAGLAKIGPAVERPGIHLGVWPDAEGQLRVWGTTRALPAFCCVIEVVASGLLVVKQRGESFGKFINVAVIEGDQIKIVDESNVNIAECPSVLKSLIGLERTIHDREGVNLLVQLAASMRAHGRGGALLIVPASDPGWRESIVTPITYAVDPPFTVLTDLLARSRSTRRTHEWQEDLRRAVEAVAGLTAVDGATILTDHFELQAFGAKIVRRRGNAVVERILVTEPIEGSVTTPAATSQLGGTRHLSAAQFVHDQQAASALVASQDGRFTVFTWSPSEDAVHAHRIEALLL